MIDTARSGQTVMSALLQPRPEKRAELQQTLRSLLEVIRAEPGCIECLVGEELEEGVRFYLHLVWRDTEALESFTASEVLRILLGALNVLANATEFRIVAARDTLSLSEWVQRHPGSRTTTKSLDCL